MLSGSKAHLQSMAELDEILRVQGCFKTVFLLCCSKIFLHLPYSADWVGGFWGSHSFNYVKPEGQWLDHPTFFVVPNIYFYNVDSSYLDGRLASIVRKSVR